jgi:hypothetical protein
MKFIFTSLTLSGAGNHCYWSSLFGQSILEGINKSNTPGHQDSHFKGHFEALSSGA